MPFRFDQNSHKVVNDNPTANTKTDLTAPNAPKSSHGQLASSSSGSSQAKIPGHPGSTGNNDRSRKRTLGAKFNQPNLGPVLKRGFVIISLIVIALTGLIYAVSQQFKFNQNHADQESATGQDQALILLPKGKKLSALGMHQFLIKLAARAVEESNYQAGARLYGHAAEQARLGGPNLSKQYMDALFAQGEVYQYNLSEPDKARPIFEKVLKAQQADASTKPIKLANSCNDLADSLSSDNDANKDRIQGLYQKAISLAKAASDTRGHAYYCYNAGDYYCVLGQYDKALTMAKESLAVFAKLKEADLTDVGDSHYLAARSLGHMAGRGHFEQADSEYEAALETYEKAETDFDHYANCARDAAWNKLRLGQRSEAKELFEKVVAAGDDDEQGQSADSYINNALK